MEKDDLEKRAETSKFQLIKGDTSKYHGKYVALSEFNSGEVIAYGKDPARVVKKARRKGIKDPVIVFVPHPNMPYFYNVA